MCSECNWPKTEEKKFYSHGKFFDKFEELLEFNKEWMELDCAEKDLEEYFRVLSKEFYLNLHLFSGSFKNKDMVAIIIFLRIEMLLQLQKYNKDEKIENGMDQR